MIVEDYARELHEAIDRDMQRGKALMAQSGGNQLLICPYCSGTGVRSTLIPENTDPDYDEAQEHLGDELLMEVAQFTGLRVRDVGELDYRLVRVMLETARR